MVTWSVLEKTCDETDNLSITVFISVTNLVTISITSKEQNMSKVCYMITRVLFRTLSK